MAFLIMKYFRTSILIEIVKLREGMDEYTYNHFGNNSN